MGLWAFCLTLPEHLCLLPCFHSVAPTRLSLDMVATETDKGAKLWFLQNIIHSSSVGLFWENVQGYGQKCRVKSAAWYKYTSLWCCPTPPSSSHPLLEHYLLVDFMEITRKPDKMSTFSATARWRFEIGLIKLEIFCSVLRTINTSTQQQPPDWVLQCEENTTEQHLLQIAAKKEFWGYITKSL